MACAGSSPRSENIKKPAAILSLRAFRHTQYITHRGTCGKPVVGMHYSRPKRIRRPRGREPMDSYVLDFQEIDRTQVAVVGGKGAHLGELSRIEGVRVPPGFCVTTDAFRRMMAEAPSIDDRLDRLSRLKPDDREAIRGLSAEIRGTLEDTPIPGDLAEAITGALARL